MKQLVLLITIVGCSIGISMGQSVNRAAQRETVKATLREGAAVGRAESAKRSADFANAQSNRAVNETRAAAASGDRGRLERAIADQRAAGQRAADRTREYHDAVREQNRAGAESKAARERAPIDRSGGGGRRDAPSSKDRPEPRDRPGPGDRADRTPGYKDKN